MQPVIVRYSSRVLEFRTSLPGTRCKSLQRIRCTRFRKRSLFNRRRGGIMSRTCETTISIADHVARSSRAFHLLRYADGHGDGGRRFYGPSLTRAAAAHALDRPLSLLVPLGPPAGVIVSWISKIFSRLTSHPRWCPPGVYFYDDSKSDTFRWDTSGGGRRPKGRHEATITIGEFLPLHLTLPSVTQFPAQLFSCAPPPRLISLARMTLRGQLVGDSKISSGRR